jgi:hypothetical protein
VQAARTATLLLITAVLALGISACGGAEVEYQEVPGPPAGVPIPDDQTSLEGGGAAEDAADPDATPTPTAEDGTAVPEDQSGAAGTDQAATTEPAPAATADPGTTDSGGSTAPAEPDGPANDTPPPEGSEAQQFEDFCAQNPGAC